MNPNFYAAVALVIVSLLAPSALAQVDVTTPGNLLALLPSAGLASSTENFVGGGIAHSVNNLVNTATQDDGLTFLDNDTNQRLAITGFNSVVRKIRLFSDPVDGGRLPPSLTIYYSTLSTTSLTSSDSNYTGANGGLLVPTMSLSPASFNHPIAGANASYLELFVNSPAGTRTLLLQLGAAAGLGDRVSEIQAFALPEPTTFCLLAAASLLVKRRRLDRGPRKAESGRDIE
jgi:hypothetical protein